MVLSGYRRDDYADPDGFVAQLLVIFESYPDDLIEYVTAPLTGIQVKIENPPGLAKIKAFVEAEAAQRARLAKWRNMKASPRPPVTIRGNRANVLVRSDHARYPEMVERAKSADTLEFRYDAAGIWVAENWLPGMKFGA